MLPAALTMKTCCVHIAIVRMVFDIALLGQRLSQVLCWLNVSVALLSARMYYKQQCMPLHVLP